jgi:hypothetical protein
LAANLLERAVNVPKSAKKVPSLIRDVRCQAGKILGSARNLPKLAGKMQKRAKNVHDQVGIPHCFFLL